MDWEVEFYQKENGEIPVEDFLLSLNPKLRAKAYSDILLLKKLGINIREPFSTAIKGERYKGLFVLLHGFVKKTNKTPERELEKALSYKLDYERRCQDE
ncbi:MAG: type II toxin-antitoxin system RelE/ParE family toxin [Thermincolia bacterium]